MTLADLSIIYLSFGAPLAVYKYLQNRGTRRGRRVLISILTFFFWLPAAFEIGYLYLRNAYSNDGFVSKEVLDSNEAIRRDLREAITSEIFRVVEGSSLHDVRETVDRYAGLAEERRRDAEPAHERSDLFEAAGRRNYSLGQTCLMRRNLRRLERHHTQARHDFVTMIGEAASEYALGGTIKRSIELARQLNDLETVQHLVALEQRTGEVWKPEQLDQSPSIKTVSPIVMTASLNNE